ncbi:MAG: PAS domain S-box protein [Planctomycetes bacterium]|nr:PAS domain S-box protein [Planctomycetota bacterium]
MPVLDAVLVATSALATAALVWVARKLGQSRRALRAAQGDSERAHQLEHLVESLTDGAALISPEGVCLAEFGPDDHHRVSDLLGQLSAETRSGFTQQLQQVLSSHEPQQFRFESGARRYQARIHPVATDEIPEPVAAVVVADVTDQEQSASRLGKLAARSEAILRSAMDGFFVVGEDRRFVEVNDAFCRMTGYSSDELLQMKISDLELNEPAHGLGVANPRTGLHQFPTAHRHKDGHPIQLEISVVVLRDEGRKILVGFARDVTERVRAEAALRENEEKFRAITGSATDAIILMDDRGLISYWNPAAERIFGYTSQEALGQELHIFLAPEQYHEAYRTGFGAFHTKGHGPVVGQTIEFLAVRKDGTSFPIEVSTSALKINSKWHAAGIVRDVTERRRAEEELRLSEERIQQVVENSQEWVWEVDTEGRYTYASPVVEKVLGAKPEELVGHSYFYDWFHPEERERLTQLTFRMLRRRQAMREIVTRNVHRNGKVVWLSTSAVPIVDDDGNLIGYRGSATDVTKRKLAEEALERLSRQNKLILDSAGEGICGVDETGYITFANPAAARMLGWEIDELIGRSQHELLHGTHPNDPEHARVHCTLMAVFRDGTAHHGMDEAFRRKDGTSFSVDYVSTPIREHGQLVGAVTVFRDVTARKQAEEALRESEQRFRTLAESIPGVIYLCRHDEQFTVLYLNDAIAALTGYPKEEFLEGRRQVIDLCHAEDVAALRSEVDQALAARRPYRHVSRIRHRSGEWRWIEGIGVGVFRDEQLLFLEGFLSDITERKQAEEERRQLEAQVQQAQKLESLGLLAGGVAHDFNNLLVSILANASLAREALEEHSAVRAHLQKIINAGRRAAEVTRQMLAYSGRASRDAHPMSLNELIREMADFTRAAVPRTVTLEINLDAGLPAIEADSGQIEQVIMNLLMNASEAIGHRAGRVSVSTSICQLETARISREYAGQKLTPGKYVRLEVRDDGCGMSPETQARIFDPFFTTKSTGRGLGLASMLGIVRAHGGAVRVHSKPDNGTLFTVLFPALKQMPRRKVAAIPRHRLPAGLTVLVIDDEEDIREVVQMILEGRGVRVLTAEDGARGVELFKQNAEHIDVVLLDMTMPGMNGEEVFKEITALRPETRVIFSSGYSEQQSVSRLGQAALAGFVQKPYTAEALVQRLSAALARN